MKLFKHHKFLYNLTASSCVFASKLCINLYVFLNYDNSIIIIEVKPYHLILKKKLSRSLFIAAASSNAKSFLVTTLML